MEIFKCFQGMNPMYLNDLFCRQETTYDFWEKPHLSNLIFQQKLTATGRSDIVEQHYGMPCLSKYRIRIIMAISN